MFDLPLGTDILNLEYNNRDNRVYGLFRNLADNFFAVASLDIETVSIADTIYIIDDLQYFVQGASVSLNAYQQGCQADICPNPCSKAHFDLQRPCP